jgi:hypothetical protein
LAGVRADWFAAALIACPELTSWHTAVGSVCARRRAPVTPANLKRITQKHQCAYRIDRMPMLGLARREKFEHRLAS